MKKAILFSLNTILPLMYRLSKRFMPDITCRLLKKAWKKQEDIQNLVSNSQGTDLRYHSCNSTIRKAVVEGVAGVFLTDLGKHE